MPPLGAGTRREKMPSNLERAKKEYQKSREEIAKAIATRFYDAYIANHIPEASLACLEMADSILSILASHGFGIRGEKLMDEGIVAACGLLSINYRKIAQVQYDQFWGIEELRKWIL